MQHDGMPLPVGEKVNAKTVASKPSASPGCSPSATLAITALLLQETSSGAPPGARRAPPAAPLLPLIRPRKSQRP